MAFYHNRKQTKLRQLNSGVITAGRFRSRPLTRTSLFSDSSRGFSRRLGGSTNGHGSTSGDQQPRVYIGRRVYLTTASSSSQQITRLIAHTCLSDSGRQKRKANGGVAIGSIQWMIKKYLVSTDASSIRIRLIIIRASDLFYHFAV